VKIFHKEHLDATYEKYRNLRRASDTKETFLEVRLLVRILQNYSEGKTFHRNFMGFARVQSFVPKDST
jgi:hypothetical protein